MCRNHIKCTYFCNIFIVRKKDNISRCLRFYYLQCHCTCYFLLFFIRFFILLYLIRFFCLEVIWRLKAITQHCIFLAISFDSNWFFLKSFIWCFFWLKTHVPESNIQKRIKHSSCAATNLSKFCLGRISLSLQLYNRYFYYH